MAGHESGRSNDEQHKILESGITSEHDANDLPIVARAAVPSLDPGVVSKSISDPDFKLQWDLLHGIVEGEVQE